MRILRSPGGVRRPETLLEDTLDELVRHQLTGRQQWRNLRSQRSSGLGLGPLPMAAGGRGAQGAVIGYPGGGDEKSGAAVVDDQVNAQGRDIYNQGFVTRQIFILQANVIPGNSGGPLINVRGAVLGVVFAASSSDPSQAYALTDAEPQRSQPRITPAPCKPPAAQPSGIGSDSSISITGIPSSIR